MRVVIADDEPITRMDLKEMLEKEGYEVAAEAGDGFDAIEACRQEKPDLAILDVKMPLLDGLMASQVISEESVAGAVVLLTAYDDRKFIEEAKKAKVSGYLMKPIREGSLIPALEIALERSHEIQRLKEDYEMVSKRLESRVVIEQAKGVIMSSRGLSEQEAYDYIRGISKSKNVAMKKIAEIILMRRGK
ncbi:response regulator [Blautia liquoris]|uniref:Stage 0 sporulation protein A homolog n=1 Tax=Blautia liquoris TaxID=2779518 RepID=A0A7M2RKJ0_9FIRM|nr:response regulator [Blautia liquoris]QOV19850.1 response regulator [Blautia liquoris]